MQHCIQRGSYPHPSPQPFGRKPWPSPRRSPSLRRLPWRPWRGRKGARSHGPPSPWRPPPAAPWHPLSPGSPRPAPQTWHDRRPPCPRRRWKAGGFLTFIGNPARLNVESFRKKLCKKRAPKFESTEGQKKETDFARNVPASSRLENGGQVCLDLHEEVGSDAHYLGGRDETFGPPVISAVEFFLGGGALLHEKATNLTVSFSRLLLLNARLRKSRRRGTDD